VVLISASVLCALVLIGLLFVRDRDLPQPEPVSPFRHLDERKAAIYENLRDLQFEYRVGKLSDADYQQTKLDLQKELAKVLAEVDRVKGELQIAPQPAARAANAVATAPPPKPKRVIATVCPNCGAEFGESLKFCGECGAPIAAIRGQA
jgi:hypothetical protein